MPKFFVCSDIHSAYTPWMQALNKAGFDKNNQDHKIILCGDLFDRMDETIECYNFVKDMLGRNQFVYIHGNHESLLLDCLRRGFPYDVDWHNGTAKTIIDFAPNANTFKDACVVAYGKVMQILNKTVDWFETEHYVFCHSWVPVNCDDTLPNYYRRNRKFSKNDDWRSAHGIDWDRSMWMNPLEMAMNGFGIEKTIVSGHWHCSAGWAAEKGLSEFGDDACFDPYYYKDKLIMLDACVAHSGKINVLAIEDNYLESKWYCTEGKRLYNLAIDKLNII